MIVVGDLQRLGQLLDQRSVRWGVLGALSVGLVLLISRGGPLAWDEAVYSSLGKDLAATNFDWAVRSQGYWSDVRAPGLPVVQAWFFEVFGVSDFVARLPIVMASVALLAVIARILDLFTPQRVGTSAIIVVGLCPGFVATASLAFADHAATLVVATAVLVAASAFRRRSGSGLWAVPVLLALATTVRFGAVLVGVAPLVVIGAAVVVDAVRRRSIDVLRPFTIAGVSSVVVVLGLLNTTLLTRRSSPAAATRAIVDAGSRPVAQGFSDLWEIMRPGPVDYGFGGAFWGWSYFVVFGSLCLVVAARLLVARRFSVIVFVLFVGSTPFILYAFSVRQFVTTYASPLFAAAAAAVAWGAWAIGPELENERSDDTSRVPTNEVATWTNAVSVVLPTLVAVLVAISTFRGVTAMHDRLDGWEGVVDLSRAANGAIGPDCRILTARVPQAAWYSECRVAGFASPLPADASSVDEYLDLEFERFGVDRTDGRLGFVLLDGLAKQPTIDDLWTHADPERSMVVRDRNGRRAALLVIP